MELIFLYHLLEPEGCHEDISKCFKLPKDERYFRNLCSAVTESSFSLALFMCLSRLFSTNIILQYTHCLRTWQICYESVCSFRCFIHIYWYSSNKKESYCSRLGFFFFFAAFLVAEELNCLSDVISSCQKAYLTQKSILYSESMKSPNRVTAAANSIVIYRCLLRANYVSITNFLRLYLGAFPGMDNQHMIYMISKTLNDNPSP